MTETVKHAAVAVLALPLFAFLLQRFVVLHRPRLNAGGLSAALTGGAHVAAWVVAMQSLPRLSQAAGHGFAAFDPLWLALGQGWKITFGFWIDGLSLLMILIVTGISTGVQVYATAYMREDADRSRFFSLLSLFTFAMLGLVVATNALQLFVFWELVGAVSYLLIGFWQAKPAAVAASQKAFVINRFADVFFLGGLLLVAMGAGGLAFETINDSATVAAFQQGHVSFGGQAIPLTAAVLLIFIGAWAKSAMFPMHVWLPDAMEGPTPVSSLIHSATMVVAGIYLVARVFPLLAASPMALAVIEGVGVSTALFAALVACAQTDLKRILAFSTLSQLGYMMFALGLGGGDAVGRYAYSASMFHVFTHAAYKCLLFLSAGVVVHAARSQELGDMSGLRRRLPWTYVFTWGASLALAGLPPFSGFFSKDAILFAALSRGHALTLTLALLTGALTAFYVFRLFFTVFHGPYISSGAASIRPHDASPAHGPESPALILPMGLLALMTLVSGFFEKRFFSVVSLPMPSEFQVDHALANASWLPWLAGCLALLGVGTAFWRHALHRDTLGLEPDSPLWHRLLHAKFHIDAVWDFAARKLLIAWAGGAAHLAESKVMNGYFAWVTWVLRLAALLQAYVQNGRIAWYTGAGVIGFGLLVWFSRVAG